MAKALHLISFFIYTIHYTECLTCYSCPLTNGLTSQDSNLNCLMNSTDIVCDDTQDRCFSSIKDEESSTIIKGCTSSDQCIGNTICCTDNFCNAGHATGMKTGHGKPCQIQSDCIQHADDMICAQSYDDVTLLCRCTDHRFNHGAICKSKSGINDICENDEQCMLYNSFCEENLCRCGDQFYPNTTEIACNLKRPLSSPCSTYSECRARNSVCTAGVCTCKFGSYTALGGDHCSGGASVPVDLARIISILVGVITIFKEIQPI